MLAFTVAGERPIQAQALSPLVGLAIWASIPATLSQNEMAQRTCLAIVLAAGEGTRMQSRVPKVLHKIGGRTMLDWVIDVAQALYAFGAALCVFDPLVSIGFIVLVQLNFAIAPRIPLLSRI